MKSRFSAAFALTGAALAALALAGCGGGTGNVVAVANNAAPPPTIPPPNGGDWTTVVSETPEGGFRMGNPDAPVKLVEYASITCPHCAEFTHEASTPLREIYVKSGQVSWEYRPTMLFPSDPGIFQLLRCQGPATFFALTDRLYATQGTWVPQLQAQAASLNAAPPQLRVAAMVRAAGIDQFFRQSGMPAARVESCLGDRAALERQLAQSQEVAQRDNVQGTPTFFINGREVEGVGAWRNPDPNRSLEARLRAAIGG